ncbi:hypothetical protein ACFE04_010549 [Oxalis oulophora]
MSSLLSKSPTHLRSLLRQCTRQSITTGEKLHALIITSGLATNPNTFLHNTLLHFYAATGASTHAHQLFNVIPHSHKDTVDWTTLMNSLAHDNKLDKALSLFVEMRKEGLSVDEVTMVCFFGACARLSNAVLGSQGHVCMVKLGLGFSVNACNALMDMYGKCGLVREVRQVFEEMGEKSLVTWTILLDAVVKWEGVRIGREVFDQMKERNEIAWTLMIAGYVGSGLVNEGYLLLREMGINMGIWINDGMICSILPACAQSGDVLMGKWVHVHALKAMGRDLDIKAGTALVDMYAKCGQIDTALRVFNFMPRRNVVAWNVLLNGLAMHGMGKLVVDMVEKMIEEAQPDDLTLMAVLSACSHTGLVDEGRHCFYNLESVYGIVPKMEHYACVVDLLGRAGFSEEAESIIKDMPFPPNKVVLGSLLASYSAHQKVEHVEKIVQELVRTDPHNTDYHVLLSNMYALSGKSEKADLARKVLKNKGIQKLPGMSSIHVNGQVYHFSAGDKSHPQSQDIYVNLHKMIGKLRLAGYVPNTSSQVFSGSKCREESNVDELEEREQALFSHSEKLAVCFGLISTRAGTPLYVFKNLRICADCHCAIKIVSKVYQREIVVRDRNRFHRFVQGSCSCSDYW